MAFDGMSLTPSQYLHLRVPTLPHVYALLLATLTPNSNHHTASTHSSGDVPPPAKKIRNSRESDSVGERDNDVQHGPRSARI